MMQPRIRSVLFTLLMGGAALVALPFFLLGGAIAYEVGGEYLARTPFRSSTWQDSARVFSREPVRIRMVDDLLTRHELEGATRDEVVAILGEPDRTAYFREWDLVYWLGPERGLFGVDSEWLVLRLDEDQRVVQQAIVAD